MAVKPEQLHALAETQSRQRGEAWRRSAISRAYYASFHFCAEWERRLPRMGKSGKSTFGVHQRLIERLGSPDGACSLNQQARSKELGNLLRKQKERRVKADYRLPSSVRAEELEEQMEDVRQVFRVCAS
jgi:hypothetical protein